MNFIANSKNKISWKDYLLMFLILTTSANQFVGQNIEIFIIFGFLFIFYAYSSVLKININKEAVPILIILFFISFEFIHRVIFGLHNTLTIIRILGYYFFAYFSVKALKIKFIDIFINLIYFFAIVSLIFYVISLIPGINMVVYNFADKIFPVKPDFTGYHRPTIIIFTFSPEYIIQGIAPLRNAGFTFEAGMLGFFLNLAIFFYHTNSKGSIKTLVSDKKSLIMIIALILTFSTTAYIVFFIYLIYFSYSEKGIKKYFFILVTVFLVFYTFNKAEFLKNKIEFQLSTAQTSQNRFGSAFLDWQNIKQKPFFGWSRKDKVLFGRDSGTMVAHRPNGFTNYLRSYGIINMLFLIGILFVAFKKYFLYMNKKSASRLAMIVLLIILISSFSELLLGKEIIKAFLFLPLVYTFSKRTHEAPFKV